MNSRLTIKELAVELAKSANKDHESAEKFLNEFITVISENIFTDRFVQVKGIGTFKIIQVEKRESIDVNTKERIVIPEHYKLTFSPEKDLKETVNKPFSFFESIELNDDSEFASVETELEKEKSIDGDEDADDDVDSMDNDSDPVQETTFIPEPQLRPVVFDLIATEEPIEETLEEMIAPFMKEEVTFVERIEPEITNIPEEPVIEPAMIKPEMYKIEEVKIEAEQEEKIVSESIPVMNEIIEVEAAADEPEPAPEEVQKDIFNKKEVNHLNENDMDRFSDNERNKGFGGGGRGHTSGGNSNNTNTLVALLLVLVVILIIALGSVVFMSRDLLFGGGAPVAKVTTITLPDDETDDESMMDEWGIEDEDLGETEDPGTLDPPVTESNIIANVQIKRGDRLNLIALDYYGNKVFWVYIYEHNKTKITNPNNIPVGLELEIPAKSIYNIDANDRESVRKASVLQSQILSKYRRNDPYGNSYNQYNNSYNQYNDPYQNQYQNQNQYQQIPNQYQQTPNYY